MAERQELGTQPATIEGDGRELKSHGSLDADIIIANAPDPVFVSDLEGKILQANDAVSQLLGFRQDEVLEQSLSRFINLMKPGSSRRRCAKWSNGVSCETWS